MKNYYCFNLLQVSLFCILTLHFSLASTFITASKFQESNSSLTVSKVNVTAVSDIIDKDDETQLSLYIERILKLDITLESSEFLNDIVDLLNKNKNYILAEKLLQKALEDAIHLKDFEFIQSAAIEISNLYLDVGDYEKASRVLLSSLEYGENTSQYAEVLNQLGILQATNRNYELAEKYFEQALTESQAKKDIKEQIRYTTNMALNLHKLKKDVQATKLFEQNRALISKHPEFSSYLVGINHNEALLAQSKKDYKIAYQKLSKALTLTATHEIPEQNKILIQTMLARSQRMLGMYKEAEESLLKLAEENNDENNAVNLVNIYLQLSYLYNTTEDFEKAYTALRTSNRYWFKMMSSNKQDEILNLNFKYDLKENQREIEFLKKEKAYKNEQLKLQQNQLIYITSFSILLGVLLIFIYTNQLKIKRKNKIINTKNDELYDLNETLATLNCEKDNFMNLVAHDLKNPLINIQLYTDLHQKDETKIPILEKVFTQIRKETRKGLILIKEVLNTHFIEQFSQKEITFSQENLNTMIYSILESNQTAIQQKQLQINLQFADDTLMFVHTEPIILIRIVENLISNAIKYSFTQHSIHIYTEERKEHHYVSITDTGGGISTQEEAVLFDKFANISSKPKGAAFSSGLGLAACKLLADKINIDLVF